MTKYIKLVVIDLAALLLGILLVFAFAPYNLFPLAILAPAGLLALWMNQSPQRTAWLGFVFGLGLFGAGVYWIYISVHDFGGLPPVAASCMTALVVAILAVFPAVTGYLLSRFFSPYRSSTLILAFPAVWVMIEFIRSWVYTGFPWLFIGYSQSNSPLKGFAPIFSVYGISLAALVTAGLLVNIVICYRQKQLRSALMQCGIISLIWLSGGLLTPVQWTKPDSEPVKVSLVQGNIPQSLKWSPEHVALSLNRYKELTEPLLEKGRIIIWPEAAIPLPLSEANDYINDLDAKARKAGAHIVLGIPIRAENGAGYYNAVITLGDDKHVYLKRRLVPFGEYVPFTHVFSRLFDFMDIPMSNMLPGKYNQAPTYVGKHKVFISICYEITYPEFSKINDADIGFMLTVTNDAWFGDSSAQTQHLQMAQMRAMELRRPVLFVTNDGITAVIQPDGAITSTVNPHETIVLNDSVQAVTGLTPWMHYGMDPILVILLGMLGIAAWNTYKYKHKQKANSTDKRSHLQTEGLEKA